jgi:hypothetical protein
MGSKTGQFSVAVLSPLRQWMQFLEGFAQSTPYWAKGAADQVKASIFKWLEDRVLEDPHGKSANFIPRSKFAAIDHVCEYVYANLH